MLRYLMYFILFGFAGWIIDSTCRSIKDKKFTSRTYLPFFATVYAVGCIGLMLIFRFVQQEFAVQVMIGGIFATV